MFFNIFSGKTYSRTGDLMLDSEGKMFTKLGNNWISEDGDLIQKTSTGFENLNTGVRSEFGDPFEVKL
jgi:flagellar basal body rod protein FlgG